MNGKTERVREQREREGGERKRGGIAAEREGGERRERVL